jgi:chemotaxis protein MotB
MGKRIILAAWAVALAAGLSACSVMQSTYQKKVDEADTLTTQLGALQKKYDTLSSENAYLRSQNARLSSDLSAMTLQRDKLTTDLAYVTGQRDKLAEDREELEKALQARSDTHSQLLFEMRKKVSDLEEENAKLKRENANLQKAKEEQVQKVSTTYESLLEKMKSEIAQGQVTISELKGKLTVNMVDSILFDSGKAEVKKDGRAVLQKVISILQDVKDRSIRIEGHTDNVPISAALAKRFPTNWELSAARAINVARYLQEQGIDPAQLSAAAYGPYHPVGDNATPEGRAKNRRIEINLVPRE